MGCAMVPWPCMRCCDRSLSRLQTAGLVQTRRSIHKVETLTLYLRAGLPRPAAADAADGCQRRADTVAAAERIPPPGAHTRLLTASRGGEDGCPLSGSAGGVASSVNAETCSVTVTPGCCCVSAKSPNSRHQVTANVPESGDVNGCP